MIVLTICISSTKISVQLRELGIIVTIESVSDTKWSFFFIDMIGIRIKIEIIWPKCFIQEISTNKVSIYILSIKISTIDSLWEVMSDGNPFVLLKVINITNKRDVRNVIVLFKMHNVFFVTLQEHHPTFRTWTTVTERTLGNTIWTFENSHCSLHR